LLHKFLTDIVIIHIYTVLECRASSTVFERAFEEQIGADSQFLAACTRGMSVEAHLQQLGCNDDRRSPAPAAQTPTRAFGNYLFCHRVGASRSSSRPMSSANANRNYVIDADTDDSDFAEWGWWSRLRRILSGVLLYFSCINKFFTFYVWVGGTGCTKDLYKFLHIQNRQYCRIHQRDSTSSEAARAATFTDTVNVQCQNSPVYRVFENRCACKIARKSLETGEDVRATVPYQTPAILLRILNVFT